MKSWAARLLDLALLAVIGAGLAVRIAGVPAHQPDSADEWGNTLTPLRILYEGGNPGSFLHPSLYYDVTAAAYAAAFGLARAAGVAAPSWSMADLFVADERWFVFTARAVSVASAALAMAALFAIGRRLWSRESGLAAAALLALLPLHAVYSEAVRVDSLFLAVFLFAVGAVARVLDATDDAAPARAAVLCGLAVGANYNGVILLPWLLAALLLRPAGAGARDCGRAILLATAAFLASSPFMLFDAITFMRHVGFIASLSTAVHPGAEGRDPLFYVRELWSGAPLLAGLVAVATLLTAFLGTRTERFLLTLPVAYLALFSWAVQTKFDRFILPALALFLLVAAGLPAVLARRAGRGMLSLAAWAAIAAALVQMWPTAVPLRRHEMLARPDGVLFDWLGDHAPRGATVLVEAGLVPLLDAIGAPDPLGLALRQSLVRARPALDLRVLGAAYVGGLVNYAPDLLDGGRIDYAVVSIRNLQGVAAACDALAERCAFYREMQARGQLVFTTPEGVEPVAVYAFAPSDSH